MGIRAIMLLGAPGAGKGTMAEGIRATTPFEHVSTGDMLREAIKAGSAVGGEAEGYMKRGDLVPDPLIIRIVMDRIDRGRADACYLFDGFPRTLVQARLLDEQFGRRAATLDVVFLLEVTKELVLQRLTGRRICRACGANFHVVNIPPRKTGVCDRCCGELYQRADDSEATILNRLEVFNRQTAELVAYYEQKGVLVRLDSARHRNETMADIQRMLRERRLVGGV